MVAKVITMIYFLTNYVQIVWEKTFMNIKPCLLYTSGVWSSAEVWLNGNELGRHDCGYTSFAFDVTNKLKVDEPNKLAVSCLLYTSTASI